MPVKRVLTLKQEPGAQFPRGEVGVAIALSRLGAGCLLPPCSPPSQLLSPQLSMPLFLAPLLPFATLLFANISLCRGHEKPRRSSPSE